MKKKIIVVFTAIILGVCIGAGLGYGPLLRYKSDGVLSMEMGTSEYKRFAELAIDPNTARQFVNIYFAPDLDINWTNRLINVIAKGLWFKPVPKVSKADTKELPDSLLQMDKDKSQAVYLGLRLTHTAASPEEAAKGAAFLGSYFKDVATRESIRDQVSYWTAENRQFTDRAIVRKLKYQFDIEQAEIRSAALKKLVASYPDSAQRESQQVVDVRKDNEKFMSPMAQLIGSESEIIDIRGNILKLDREMEQQTFAKAIVADAEVALNKAQSGSESVINLSSMILRFSKLVKTEAEREKLSSMAADVSQISARFLSQAEFIAKPSVPTRSESPRPLMIMILLGLLTGFLSAVFLWRDTLKKMIF